MLTPGMDGHEHRVAQARGEGLKIAAVGVHRQDLGVAPVFLLAGVATGAHGNQQAPVPGPRQKQKGPGEMAAARRQVGDFLLAGGRETFRVVFESRHPAGFRHIEPGFFFRAEGQAVRLIQPIEHGHHRIGHAVIVFIRQGHHLSLGGEADQKGTVGVQGQDPGARQILSEYGDGKARGSFKGREEGRAPFPSGGGGSSRSLPISRGGGRTAGLAPRKFCQ